MRNLFIIGILLSACSGPTNKESDQGSGDDMSYSGTFILPNATLTVKKSESSVDEAIDFQIDAIAEESQLSVFNSASLETFDDNSVTFIFKDLPVDQGGNGLQDLQFKFSYQDDAWEIQDWVAINKQDSTRNFNLSGIYERQASRE